MPVGLLYMYRLLNKIRWLLPFRGEAAILIKMRAPIKNNTTRAEWQGNMSCLNRASRAAAPVSAAERPPESSRPFARPAVAKSRSTPRPAFTRSQSLVRAARRPTPPLPTRGMRSMLRTRSGLPKHCSWNLDRKDGKRRVRFRKNGFSTYLTGAPWSDVFMRQYAAALEGVKAQVSNVGSEHTVAGTVNALIIAYLDPRDRKS